MASDLKSDGIIFRQPHDEESEIFKFGDVDMLNYKDVDFVRLVYICLNLFLALINSGKIPML